MTELRVELDGLELSDEQAQRISSDVQRVVAAELAGVDFGGDAYAIIKNPEWLGIWLRQLRAEQLTQIDPGITERFGRKF
jgi:hypothetical protein